jgi:hypothetical protein
VLNLLLKDYFLLSLLPFDFSEEEATLSLQTKRLQSIEYMFLFLAQPGRQESTGRGAVFFLGYLADVFFCTPFWDFPAAVPPFDPHVLGSSSKCTVLGKGGFLTFF